MTYATLDAMVQDLQSAVATAVGAKSAPAYGSGAPADFPLVFAYPAGVQAQHNSPEDYRGLWDVNVDLLVSAQSQPDALLLLATISPEAALNALFKQLKTNIVAHKEITCGPPQLMEWGGVPCLGYRFVVHEAKFLVAIT